MEERNLTRHRTGDNRCYQGLRTVLAVAGLATLGAAGCGGGSSDAADAGAEPDGRLVSDRCALVTTRSAVDTFFAVADRVTAGHEVSLEVMGQAVSEPRWEHWRRSFEPEQVAALPIARALFIATRGQDALPERLRNKPYRVDLVSNYEEVLEHRDLVERFLDTFVAEDVACGVRDLLQGWLPATDLADTLHLDLVVGHPEIRYFEDRLMLDAGLAWAAGAEQIVRFLASTLYRDARAVGGPSPDQVAGPDVALHSLRLVYNEAIPAYLDHLDDLALDGRHRLLSRAAPVPENLCDRAMRTLDALDTVLTRLRAWEDPSSAPWDQTHALFVGAQSWQATGWFMARTIAAMLGEERLREASATLPGFFAAYVEACEHLPAAPTARPGSVAYYLQQAPRLSPENAAWLDQQLRRLSG